MFERLKMIFGKKEEYVPYKERETRCDNCEFVYVCDLYEITTGNDISKHYLPKPNTKCKKDN